MQHYYRSLYLLLIMFTMAIGMFTYQLLPMGRQKVASAASSSTLNLIQNENQLPGTTDWRLTNPTPRDTTNNTYDTGIEGYPSVTSVSTGETISFAVNSATSSFDAAIYRLGWYQGNGARLMKLIPNIPGRSYPIPTPKPHTGLVEANWPAAFAISIPSKWVSGVYLVKLTNANGLQSYIPFVVKTAQRSDFVLIHTVNTDEAYNSWGGASLYQDFTKTLSAGRAFKVSFDRPFYEFEGVGNLFYWEYPMIRWLEKSGYAVSYLTDVDVNNSSKVLLGHHGVLLAGHSEYWSGAMRAHLEAAVNGGENLGAFGANNIYWQVRYESSPVTGVPNRVITCYKDASLDPLYNKNNSRVTVEFRSSPVNNPEQLLLGSMYASIVAGNGEPWVVNNASSWVFAGTNLNNGDSIPGLVGYEFDRAMTTYPFAYPMPATSVGADGVSGVELLSVSPVTDTNGNATTSNSTLYTAPGGARVFNAGTMQWSWGLDNFEFPFDVNPAIQQITANILHNFLTGTTTYVPAAVTTTAHSSLMVSSLLGGTKVPPPPRDNDDK